MIIKGIRYKRYGNTPKQWKIVGRDKDSNDDYVYFGFVNLLVSKNAGGKSRTIDVIEELAEFVGERKRISESLYSSQVFDFLFEHDNKIFRYFLDIRDRQIYGELLYEDSKEVFNRLEGKYSDLYGFEIPQNVDSLIINQCLDGGYIFPDLVFWGKAMRIFLSNDVIDINEYIGNLDVLNTEISLNIENLGAIIPIFHWGIKKYGDNYLHEILDCMNELQYNVTNIEIRKGKKGYGLHIEEEGKYYVEQSKLSIRMFRALSLFIVLLLARREKISICILIDDIGEGFDAENSKRMIDLVINKSYNTSIQFFMTSNNRFVLNCIHLKHWSVIERMGCKSIFYNAYNSQENFEDFKYTGLNNYDFFGTEFYKNGFGEDDTQDID